MRLKGDFLDHIKHSYKWSFRIQTKNEKTLFGMQRFSIQHPETRNWLSEWLFHEAAKQEGVTSLRYKFVRVILNGKDLGIYLLEESFEKRLIEHNLRREGPIIRFDETYAIQEIQESEGKVFSGYGFFYSSPVSYTHLTLPTN